MFIFPIIFISAFVIAFREILKGRQSGILIFIIFGLSIYTTAMSISFMMGLKSVMPAFQFFKEVLILAVLIVNVLRLKYKPRFHIIDYAILAFLGYTLLYALLPIGQQGFVNRLLAFKSTSFYIVVYFTARLLDPQEVYVSKYFNYVVLLTIGAGAVVLAEFMINLHLQTMTGYADYSYYFFNFEPSGMYGLTTTFESEGGYKRFASFFANPLEHAGATLLALAIIMALYTSDKNKIKYTTLGLTAVGATILSITFALSRAPMAAYLFMIYIYGFITKRKLVIHSFHAVGVAGCIYLIYLFNRFESRNNGLIEVLMNTVDFSNPSSVGHLVEWVEGIMAMIAHPLGLGLGTSGRVAGSLGENIGGENQFIIIGVQAGVIALFLYLFIYIMIVRTSYKWLKRLQGRERQVCMAVLMIKVGIFIPLLTSEVESSSYISYMNWFLTGLLINMIMRPRNTSNLPGCRMIEKVIRKLKNDPNYKWDTVYSSRDLLSVSAVRSFQILRGLLLKPFLKASSGLLFVGSNVKVRHAYQVKVGKNLILEDNVSINALSSNGITLGDHVSIARDSILFCTGVIAQKGTGITIGDRTGISARAYIGGQGGVTIGNDVIMGPNVQIFSENHNFNDLTKNIREQGVTKKEVIIGDNCWLGAGCTILAGVTIGEGCVIAAASVVTKSVPAKLCSGGGACKNR